MEREPVPSALERINWPDHTTPEQLAGMVELCKLKDTRVVVADEIEMEGLVLRGAIKQRFGSQDQRLPMVNAYARVGQEIRWADDSLRVWRKELGRGNFIPLNTPRQRHLLLLLKDPKGFELLERLLLEKSDNGELSLSEIEGFAAGARRYCQLYDALISAGVRPKELEERFYPPIAGGARRPLLHRRKPIPEENAYRVVEEIVPGTVLIDENGDYHVFWDKSHCYFQDIQDVLCQHDRVIEKLRGTMIELGDDLGRFLEIEGEVAQAARLTQRLFLLSAGLDNASFLTPRARENVLGQLGQLKDEVGGVRDKLKKKGLLAISIALSTSEPKKAGRKTQEAAGIFLQRASDATTKLEGAIKREERIIQKRDEWEKTIVDSYNILAIYCDKLKKKIKDKTLTPRWLGTIVSQVATGENNIFDTLQSITGQPYKNRVEQPEIKKLKSSLPETVGQNNFSGAIKILEKAIIVLERVVKEKAKRERAEKSTS